MLERRGKEETGRKKKHAAFKKSDSGIMLRRFGGRLGSRSGCRAVIVCLVGEVIARLS